MVGENFGEYYIPPNSNILISPYTLHHHLSYWEDPERFNPERFSLENKKERPRFAYIPFGGGQRVCIAGNFAMMQSILVLACIVQKFEFSLVPQKIIFDHFISLKLRRLKVRINETLL